MRDDIYLFFRFPRESWTEVQSLFRRTGQDKLADVPPRISHATQRYMLRFHRESDYQHFLAEARARGFAEQYSLRRERAYTDRELAGFPFLRLAVVRAPKGFGGPWYGTQYDLSQACSQCGSGARQTSPLVLKRGEIQIPKNRRVFQTLDWEVLVTPEFARVFQEAGVTGVELRQAIASTDRQPLSWFQLLPQLTMPPMAPCSEGIIRGKPEPCPQCDRDGYFGTTQEPELIRYLARDASPAGLPDVTQTWEYFGKSGLREPLEKSHFAHPYILVKLKVFALFRQHKVHEVGFRPVEIVETC